MELFVKSEEKTANLQGVTSKKHRRQWSYPQKVKKKQRILVGIHLKMI